MAQLYRVQFWEIVADGVLQTYWLLLETDKLINLLIINNNSKHVTICLISPASHLITQPSSHTRQHLTAPVSPT